MWLILRQLYSAANLVVTMVWPVLVTAARINTGRTLSFGTPNTDTQARGCKLVSGAYRATDLAPAPAARIPTPPILNNNPTDVNCRSLLIHFAGHNSSLLSRQPIHMSSRESNVTEQKNIWWITDHYANVLRLKWRRIRIERTALFDH